MNSKGHSQKEIREVLREAKKAGWVVVKAAGGQSKPWGYIRCGAEVEECRIGIRSTARSPSGDAKRIRKAMSKCPHRQPPSTQGQP
jgi:hypothetical protein